MLFKQIFFFVLVIGWLLFLWDQSAKGKIALFATCVWCDASEVFTDWRLRNPGVYIGLSPEGRKLLARNLKTYEDFLETHPWIGDDNGHRDWLISLFDDLPPKHPKSKPTVNKKSVTTDALFLCKYV